MRWRSGASVLLGCLISVVLVAGCGAAAPDRTPDTTTAVTPDDLDTSDWIDLSGAEVPAAPPAPSSVDGARYDEVAKMLRTWAGQAIEGPESVGPGLPGEVVGLLDELAATQPAPALTRGTPLDPALTVESVRGTAAWRMTAREPVTLEVQTRVAWQVVDEQGRRRLVAMVRGHGASLGDQGWAIGVSWQEFGADDCVIAIEGLVRPGGDDAAQRTDLLRFGTIASAPTVQSLDVGVDEVLDENFVRRCRAGSV